jgi:hypothetical protein
MAERAGLRVVREEAGYAWDLKMREAYVRFGRATFVNWPRLLPESERDGFISDALARIRSLITKPSAEENIFKFYQMEIVCTPEPNDRGREEMTEAL